MRRLLIIVIVLGMGTLPGCTTPFNVYLRNFSSVTTIVNVWLLTKQDMKTLPNKVKVANSIVDFKGNYKQYLNKMQNVIWLDTVHFKFELAPNTTADLTDMTAKFTNSYPHGDFRVTVTNGNKTDTLLNGDKDFRHKLFSFKSKGLSPWILYYDVK